MEQAKSWKALVLTEDWWAVWLGLGIVLMALIVFLAGGTISGWAVTPGSWDSGGRLAADFVKHFPSYLILFGGWLVIFTLSCGIMGQPLKQYIPGFIVVFLGSLAIFYLAGWQFMKRYDLGAPLLALAIGLVISNLVRIPDWMRTALRTEYYIKTGIVLLGATLPLTLIWSAGPIAFLQATIVSLLTWTTIFLVATRVFKINPKFGAVLGAGGAVCGVSASIAVGGAVRAKKDEIAISIGIV
ncbi:MAG TPA: putative sulfate exporter family transporter, partial [Bacteroidetes bacterium]|nr:putative sulfate exporter family transporter [Bacteroidota bacterium]